VFLIVGLLAGEEGPGGIVFNDFQLTNVAATAALAVILFDGGMRTAMDSFRVGLRPALVLSTVGVLITTGLVGLFASLLFKLSLAEGLLVGAIVGSTDAAAVFSLLHTNAVHLNQRVTAALEIESGTNDPMAVFLTLGLIQYLLNPAGFSGWDALQLFVQQMGLGMAFGWFGGRALAWTLNRLELSDSLYPLLAFSGGLLIFGATSLLEGSGFLAVYLAGLVIGNRPLRAFGAIRRFHDGIAWLAQIGMFVILGLVATPSRLFGLALPGLGLALLLILLARPIAVAVALAPFRFPWREQCYIGWVGLRGSVPMVLATFPFLAGLKDAQLFFDVAFFIVLVSLVVQGWTVAPAARLLDLQLPLPSARVRRIELDLPGVSGYEMVSYRIGSHSPLVGQKPKSLPIGDASRIVSIARQRRLLPYREWGMLEAGDYVSLLAAQSELRQLDELFKSVRPERSADQQRYYGEFAVEPKAPVEALADAYGVEMPEAARGHTLAGFFHVHMRNPVVGDRMRLGSMELVVRKMDGDQIVQLGLRLPHDRDA
jgi:cell volume regulation protein A